MARIIMQWLVPLAMGAWAVITWAHSQEKEREQERERLTALYINPFLSACEDLQSRIYKILELDGLDVLRERYPDGSFAEETLYLIVRYFGWSSIVSRYGPYTQDPVVIEHTMAIRKAFATSAPGHPVGPFNFFLPEQKALGKIVMHTVMHTMENPNGFELDTISYYDFKKQLTKSPLSESEAIRQSLESLRNAQHADDIEGRKRLIEAHSHLVSLLEYMEEQEQYSLFEGKRKQCKKTRHVKPRPAQAPAKRKA
jgi:hypothetical protein